MSIEATRGRCRVRSSFIAYWIRYVYFFHHSRSGSRSDALFHMRCVACGLWKALVLPHPRLSVPSGRALRLRSVQHVRGVREGATQPAHCQLTQMGCSTVDKRFVALDLPPTQLKYSRRETAPHTRSHRHATPTQTHARVRIRPVLCTLTISRLQSLTMV